MSGAQYKGWGIKSETTERGCCSLVREILKVGIWGSSPRQLLSRPSKLA